MRFTDIFHQRCTFLNRPIINRYPRNNFFIEFEFEGNSRFGSGGGGLVGEGGLSCFYVIENPKCFFFSFSRIYRNSVIRTQGIRPNVTHRRRVFDRMYLENRQQTLYAQYRPYNVIDVSSKLYKKLQKKRRKKRCFPEKTYTLWYCNRDRNLNGKWGRMKEEKFATFQPPN